MDYSICKKAINFINVRNQLQSLAYFNNTFVDFNKLLGAQKYDHFHIVIINMYASKIYMWYTHDTKTSRGHEKDKL